MRRETGVFSGSGIVHVILHEDYQALFEHEALSVSSEPVRRRMDLNRRHCRVVAKKREVRQT